MGKTGDEQKPLSDLFEVSKRGGGMVLTHPLEFF
jgi:hypothetical protein